MKKYTGPKDYVDAARDVLTPPDELSILALSDYVFVREAVAANPHTPTDALHALVPQGLFDDNDFKVAAALLRNPHISIATCNALISNISEVVSTISPRDYLKNVMLEHLFVNKAVPLLTLRELLSSDSFPSHLRGRIARPETRADVLHLLLADKSESVRLRATRAIQCQTARTEQSGLAEMPMMQD